MTTVAAICQSASAKIATLAPTRDATAHFIEHTTNHPLEKAAVSKSDGYEVVARDEITEQGFGEAETKEESFKMVVRLGHWPQGTDKERESNRAQDRAKLVDILERHTYPVGTMVVLYEKESVDKEKANFWITEIFFHVLYRGVIVTS